ncbi:TniQ family protein [Streptomyces sp. SP18ES09]|uniref:TniQ family protein n=1 Tax=Streptomyces sp. SP18ES09 TaxID=3002532 RepID=UPI002E75C0D9|nr:TniQ family protein [Streptomyces sp. SP18ES09]MEE1819690.1 TniQ family protein [Streptomyces sp. SP18ES09]
MNVTLSRPLTPLPINVRPRLGESTIHYLQRLARANHLKPSYLLKILNGPVQARSPNVDISRLATLSGRTPHILQITLADAAFAPPYAIHTRSTLRLAHLAAEKTHRRSSNIVGQIKYDALRNKGSLRQIANAWGLPRWLVKRILSPSFPSMAPITRPHLSENHHALLTWYYERGHGPSSGMARHDRQPGSLDPERHHPAALPGVRP